VGFGDAEVGQQEGHGFAAHGRTAVGVNGELVRLDVSVRPTQGSGA
jgi:hypothetical protein